MSYCSNNKASNYLLAVDLLSISIIRAQELSRPQRFTFEGPMNFDSFQYIYMVTALLGPPTERLPYRQTLI